jgi:WD40 repeat protein
VFDTETGELLYTVSTVPGENSEISQVVFSPDGQYLVIMSPQGLLDLREGRSGNQLGVYDTEGGQGISFSPTGEILAIGQPLRLIDLITGEITTVPGNYAGNYLAFSPDGSMILVDTSGKSLNDYQSVMVFGIPAAVRPEWSPVSAQVASAGINVRSGPRSSAPTIGSAAGEVSVAARDIEGEAVFLSDIEGWVWSAPEYIDLGDVTLDMLPIRMD